MAKTRDIEKVKGTGAPARKKSEAASSMPPEGRDPEGGLTEKGRKFFAERDGSHLKPGVRGPADTPEKMKRKGSFLRRMFTHPRGPMVDEKGEPTRLALSAHAWGEPVPHTQAEAKRLAGKGAKLLERFHAEADGASAPKKPAPGKRTKSTAKSKVTPREA